MTQPVKKHRLSDVARELQSNLARALAALNQIDPAALKQWMADPDHGPMSAADRALVEHVCDSLLPITRELDHVFDTLETAGEQLGLLDPHQFRADHAVEPRAIGMVKPDCRSPHQL